MKVEGILQSVPIVGLLFAGSSDLLCRPRQELYFERIKLATCETPSGSWNGPPQPIPDPFCFAIAPNAVIVDSLSFMRLQLFDRALKEDLFVLEAPSCASRTQVRLEREEAHFATRSVIAVEDLVAADLVYRTAVHAGVDLLDRDV